MKVLVVIPTYWPQGTGGNLATHLIIKLLSEVKDLNLTILTSTKNLEKIEKPNVRYVIDPFVRTIERRYPIPAIVMNRYRKLVEKHDVVYIVYAHTFIPVAKKLGKKVIVHLHDYKIVSPSSVIPYVCSDNPNIAKLIKESFRIKYLERRNIANMFLNIGDSIRTLFLVQWIQMTDTIIAVSKRQAELLTKALPSIGSKLRVIYNPLPPMPEVEKNLDPIPTFLYVGGDSYVKGFPVLLEAIVEFLKRGGKARFMFANKYSKASLSYIKAINKLFGKEIISVVGRVPHENLIEIYKKTWALIFSSICEEPLPYAIIEALATKSIPIASGVGGVSEILSSTYAENFLVQPGNSEELSEKILSLTMLTKGEIKEIQERIFMDYQRLKHTKLSKENILKFLLKLLNHMNQ